MKQGTNQRRPRGRNNNNNNGGGARRNTRHNSYESNGNEVKVRGSAQQVLDKYLQLASDAQSSSDRVKAEGYLQYAEHYYRIVNVELEAQAEQAEQAAKRAAEHNANRADNRTDHRNVEKKTEVRPVQNPVQNPAEVSGAESETKELRAPRRARRPRNPQPKASVAPKNEATLAAEAAAANEVVVKNEVIAKKPARVARVKDKKETVSEIVAETVKDTVVAGE